MFIGCKRRRNIIFIHDDKTRAIGEAPFLVETLAAKSKGQFK
jgi:hypothetical protein